MDLSWLPSLNAALNGLAAALLVVGRGLARRREVDRHARTMVSAFAVSTLFLVLYVAHKVWRGFEPTIYHGEGLARTAYLVILATHSVLAAMVPFLAITLIVLGVRRRVASHRRLARIAWPIWMYVSVTGVVIYLLLYPLNPTGP
jgi:uncharacterized membrane protein YozB (DUF420 family)